MSLIDLDDQVWSKILNCLQQQAGIYIGPEAKCRRFSEAVLWIARSGAQWRLLPRDYGQWNTVYKRFNRWSQQGIWTNVHQSMIDVAELENLLLDTTLIR